MNSVVISINTSHCGLRRCNPNFIFGSFSTHVLPPPPQKKNKNFNVNKNTRATALRNACYISYFRRVVCLIIRQEGSSIHKQLSVRVRGGGGGGSVSSLTEGNHRPRTCGLCVAEVIGLLSSERSKLACCAAS